MALARPIRHATLLGNGLSIDRQTRTHLGQSSQHSPESLHSFSLSFIVAGSCPWSRDSPRSLAPSTRLDVSPTFVAVTRSLARHRNQRLVKRESLLAQASPTHHLFRRICHRTCISYLSSVAVGRSVSQLGACASSLLPLASFLPPRQATTQAPIDNPSPRNPTSTAAH